MVLAYPYPDFETMTQKLTSRIDIYAEYGELNHLCCKAIYENPTNPELIIDMGKKIYQRGGMQALVMNFYVLQSMYSGSNIPAINGQPRIIESYFTKVCPEWQD